MKFYLIAKRIFDVLLSGVALVVLSPFLIILAVLIKTFSPGPVLFKQERMGKDGKIFKVFKFRTMKVGAEKSSFSAMEIRKLESSNSDPRVTKIGSFLRRYGIDEAPQLVNILVGDMSFVGPRPYNMHRIETNSLLKERVLVKPGLTSLAVINGGVSLSEDDILRYDLKYIKERNFCLDTKIFLKSIYFVLSGRGFYGK